MKPPTNDASPLARHWTLDPEIVFLNHGSFGACPRAVLDYQAELRARLERGPVRFMVGEAPALLDRTREQLARFLGADAQDLVFVPNATTGVNAVLRSLAFGPGDELLTTDHCYNACRNALDFVAARAGARVVVADLPFPVREPGEIVAAVVGAVTDKTRLALLDHVTSSTGLVLPIESMVAELEARGIDTLVDGAHAPGMVDLDLGKVGATYYAGNCHKWLCAPKGAAFLHVRRDRQSTVRPTTISHGANAEKAGRSRFHLEFDWTGTDDPTAMLGVGKALSVMGEMTADGWSGVRTHNHDLACSGRELLAEALGLDERPAPTSMLGSLAALPLPGPIPAAASSDTHVDPLQSRLFDKYRIEVPIFPWKPLGRRLIRISAQLYNSRRQYERLAAALQTELDQPSD